MPNGDRQAHEEDLVDIILNGGTGDILGWQDPPEWMQDAEGWEYFPDPPDYVLKRARRDDLTAPGGFDPRRGYYYGDNYVYLMVQTVHGGGVHVFSQKKSKYFETTPEEGTCPNCQEYVRRYDGDDVLTCHRCGWENTVDSLTDRLTSLF